MTRERLALFLASADPVVPRLFALFLLLARTGMRLGESLALRWQDLWALAPDGQQGRRRSAGRGEWEQKSGSKRRPSRSWRAGNDK